MWGGGGGKGCVCVHTNACKFVEVTDCRLSMAGRHAGLLRGSFVDTSTHVALSYMECAHLSG